MIRHYIPHLLLMTIILFHPDLERFPTPQSPDREMAQSNMAWEHQRSEEGQSSPYSVGSISPNNAVEEHGQLRVEGNRLVNQEGRSLQLRGMSFLWSQWIGKYYTYETVKWLRDDWHCNAVRVAMAVEHEGYLANPEREKQKIMEVIDAAIELGIYVIIDWHDHRAEDHLEESVAFFGEMAERYGSHPNIIYEPYNEPLNVPWKTTLKPYHEAVVAEIRKHDADNLIICGTPNWSQDVEDVIGARIDDPNVMYTLHYYAATHKQELRDKALLALEQGIPLFVTEYGL